LTEFPHSIVLQLLEPTKLIQTSLLPKNPLLPFSHLILHKTLCYLLEKKVKCSRYRPDVAQRVGRGIALLFHDRGTRREVSGQPHAPAELYPRERPGTHFTRGWMGPRAGLDGRKISSTLEFDPGPSSP
jgi:hypothetical protein